MRKGILFGSAFFGLGFILILWINRESSSPESYYQPRTASQQVSFKDQGEEPGESEEGYKGYVEWMHQRMANQVTGKIDMNDVLQVRQQVFAAAKTKKSSPLGLQWQSLGPDNIGGRTRCFLIDKNNPNTFYAGSVSGGLFKSTNGGASWFPVNDQMGNLAVVSLAQAPDGTIYCGTGEGMYYANTGTGAQGILGGGMFKSQDGNSFSLIQSTKPTANIPGSNWASIGKIAVDPNNSQRIYAGTNNGLQISNDSGSTWQNAGSTTLFLNSCEDMTVTPGGHVWAHIGAIIYYSASGDPGTYTVVSGSTIPNNVNRVRIAVSSEDDNYVYVVTTDGAGDFKKAYRSTDGGNTWTAIGEKNSFLNPHDGQGDYNNALAVDPKNKDRILVGGVSLWEWSLSGGWQQIASQADFSTNPFYVHADNHNILFNSNNKNTIYVTNDGGVFRSTDDGVTWNIIDQNYITTQYYSIGIGIDGSVIGGCQDNGTLYFNPNNNQPKRAIKTGSIAYGDLGNIDGDGGYADISKLDPSVAFKEMQYGHLGRTVDSGTSFSSFYDFNRMDPDGISNTTSASSGVFASFVMPFKLWEKLNDANSHDSIVFSVDSAVTVLGFGAGETQFKGTFTKPQSSSIFVADGLIITAGTKVVTSDASGNLMGDGTGTFNAATGEFNVTFNSAVNQTVSAKVAVRYDAGTTIKLKSATNEIPINYTLTQALNPGEKVLIQDPVQSAFFVGLRSRSQTNNPNMGGGIWMTRQVLTKTQVSPKWYHIGNLAQGEAPADMEISRDGNTLFVGTESGRVYRFTNLDNARDSASADIDDYYENGTLIRANTSVVQKSIMNFPVSIVGRTVTSIAIHPFNNNKVVVTVGNYGNTNYVFYSNNATAPTPIFKAVQGDLPHFPVYASTFNFNGSEKEVIIGTDYGIYTTDDIEAGSVNWNQENSGLANVPVFDLVQEITVRYDLKSGSNLDFEGGIYAGTHGRGVFETNSTADYVGIDENKVVDNSTSKVLNVYPNPTTDKVNIDLSLTKNSDVQVYIRDIKGSLVKTVKYQKLSKGTPKITLDVSSLPAGSYVISMMKGEDFISGKFIKK